MNNKIKVKNQHYISQWYLRNFSINNNQKNIVAYNLNNDFFIDSTEIKNQASKKYYYGEDCLLEERYGVFESKQSPIVKRILNYELPKVNSIEENVIFELFAFMYVRNSVFVASFSKMVDLVGGSNIYETLGSGSKEKHAKVIGFNNLELIKQFLIDLDYKILVNKTDHYFITSDLPVVVYNKYLESFSSELPTIAYGAVGLKLFLPLNENMCLILFDSTTYKIGDKKDKFVNINTEKEVDQINLLQVLNCKTMLYFNEKNTKKYINILVNESRKRKYTIQNKEPLFFNDSYVREKSININLNIRSIKINSSAKITLSNVNGNVPLRKKGFRLM